MSTLIRNPLRERDVERAVRIVSNHLAGVRRRDPEALLLDKVLGRVMRGEVARTDEAIERALQEERTRREQPWSDPLPADLGPLGEGGAR